MYRAFSAGKLVFVVSFQNYVKLLIYRHNGQMCTRMSCHEVCFLKPSQDIHVERSSNLNVSLCMIVNSRLRAVGFLLLRRRFEAVSLNLVFGHICEVGYGGSVCSLSSFCFVDIYPVTESSQQCKA
jgi:hypothetical protein